jgi:hypothetical protein
METSDAQLKLPGDPLGALPLKGADGASINLWDQSLAGHAVLLWFSGPAPSGELRAALTRELAGLDALETIAYEVTPDGAGPAAGMPLKQAIDGGAAAQTLGAAVPGYAVLDTPCWMRRGGWWEPTPMTVWTKRSQPAAISSDAACPMRSARKHRC